MAAKLKLSDPSTYRSLEMLGVLALLVAVSVFIETVPEDPQWTIKAAVRTAIAGFMLYAWGRIGYWKTTHKPTD